jgi:hypothetical protein
MDRNSDHRQRNPEAEPVVMTENRGDVGKQLQETMGGSNRPCGAPSKVSSRSKTPLTGLKLRSNR